MVRHPSTGALRPICASWGSFGHIRLGLAPTHPTTHGRTWEIRRCPVRPFSSSPAAKKRSCSWPPPTTSDLADPELNHPFSHPGHPDHVQRLAWYWGEVFGGPPRYSDVSEGQTFMQALHAGTGGKATSGIASWTVS